MLCLTLGCAVCNTCLHAFTLKIKNKKEEKKETAVSFKRGVDDEAELRMLLFSSIWWLCALCLQRKPGALPLLCSPHHGTGQSSCNFCNSSFTHGSCRQSCRRGHVCKQTSITAACSCLYFRALSPFFAYFLLINTAVVE